MKQKNLEPTVEQIKAALRLCAVDEPAGEYLCEKCYLYPFSKDGRMSTGRTCFEHLALDACHLFDRLNDFDRSQGNLALKRCRWPKAQLAESRRRERSAVDERDELQKASALACRIMGDSFPVCLPDNQSWKGHILDRARAEYVCRVCGCTEDNACPGGCYWVEPDLCSACAQAEEGDCCADSE